MIIIIRLYRARIYVNLADLGIIGIKWAYITKLGCLHPVTLTHFLFFIALRLHLHILIILIVILIQ